MPARSPAPVALASSLVPGEREGLAPRRYISFIPPGARGRSPLSKTTLSRLGAATLSLLLIACTSAPPASTPTVAPTTTAPQRQTAKVERLDLSTSLTYSAEVRTSANLTLVPKTSGRVEKL